MFEFFLFDIYLFILFVKYKIPLMKAFYIVSGTVDTNGRPIILCYAECIARAGLNKYEIAKVLLYYASIPW